MTGKIFKESSNVYEDEAKILFDYYKKAAEKIVEEEIALENKIEDEILYDTVWSKEEANIDDESVYNVSYFFEI